MPCVQCINGLFCGLSQSSKTSWRTRRWVTQTICPRLMVAELTYLFQSQVYVTSKTYVSPVVFFLILISLSLTFIKEVKCVFKWDCALKSTKLKASSSLKEGSRNPRKFTLLWWAGWTEGGCQTEFNESFLKSRWGLTSDALLFICIAAACLDWEFLPFRGRCNPWCELLSRQHSPPCRAELYGEED